MCQKLQILLKTATTSILAKPMSILAKPSSLQFEFLLHGSVTYNKRQATFLSTKATLQNKFKAQI
jgi:hypothetical protein